MDDSRIVAILIDWVNTWRHDNGIVGDEVLSGEVLDIFVSELQNEISKNIGDFGLNSSGENAKLVLYSGTKYMDVLVY